MNTVFGAFLGAYLGLEVSQLKPDVKSANSIILAIGMVFICVLVIQVVLRFHPGPDPDVDPTGYVKESKVNLMHGLKMLVPYSLLLAILHFGAPMYERLLQGDAYLLQSLLAFWGFIAFWANLLSLQPRPKRNDLREIT